MRNGVLSCTAVLLALLLPTLAAAQRAAVAVSAGDRPELRLEVRELPRGDDRLEASLVLARDPGLDLRVARSSAAGPLGTLVLEAEAGLRLASGAAGRARLTVRGVLGPVAARLEASAWGAPAERFAPDRDPGEAPYAAGTALALSADGRLDRTWLAGGEVVWTLGEDGRSAWDLAGRLRGRRLLGREADLTVATEARLADAAAGRAAAGVGLVLAPRRAPEIAIEAWLDAVPSEGGVALRPGLETRGAWRDPTGRLAWRVRARPGARDRAPWSLEASWRGSSDDGDWTVRAAARAGGPAGAGASLGIAWELPLRDPAWRDATER